MSTFNIHANVTADGVRITDGLRVFTNEMKVGKVTADRDRGSLRCCERGEAGGHARAQIRLNGWFTDHPAGSAASDRGCHCRHNHWFDVEYDEGGGGMFDGERMTTSFEGRQA